MHSFIDSLETLYDDYLQGYCRANSSILKLSTNPTFVTRRDVNFKKVSLISGGGSGHEPLHLGFVGKGMLDAACLGQLLTSPSPDQIIAAMKFFDQSEGIILLVKNYSGDKMNFQLARQWSNLNSELVIVSDDVSEPTANEARGIAGTLVFEKILGAAAEMGIGLSDLLEIADVLRKNVKSIGVALTSLTLPLSSEPMFDLPIDQLEYGVGIHGEKGHERLSNMSLELLVEKMVSDLTKGFDGNCNDILLFVNDLGNTPLIELYLLYNSVSLKLQSLGFKIVRSLVGPYVSSFDVKGASITIFPLNKKTLKLWDYPVSTPNLRW